MKIGFLHDYGEEREIVEEFNLSKAVAVGSTVDRELLPPDPEDDEEVIEVVDEAPDELDGAESGGKGWSKREAQRAREEMDRTLTMDQEPASSWTTLLGEFRSPSATRPNVSRPVRPRELNDPSLVRWAQNSSAVCPLSLIGSPRSHR